ncbi:MAG: hypothetical protein KatS3mg082_0604 [Nitrospiraceae bacterium]|nr:MAG: hypothetical protein KatS3mg082_0604 [Nitrospiraceae bacterium]
MNSEELSAGRCSLLSRHGGCHERLDQEKSGAAKATPKRTVAVSSPNPIELPDGHVGTNRQEGLRTVGRTGAAERGYALQDWLDAEAIVMEEIHEARE